MFSREFYSFTLHVDVVEIRDLFNCNIQICIEGPLSFIRIFMPHSILRVLPAVFS